MDDTTNPTGSQDTSLSYIRPPTPETNPLLRLLGKKSAMGPPMAVTSAAPDRALTKQLGLPDLAPVSKNPDGSPLYDYYAVSKRNEDISNIRKAQALRMITNPILTTTDQIKSTSGGLYDDDSAQKLLNAYGGNVPMTALKTGVGGAGTALRSNTLQSMVDVRKSMLGNMISQQNAKMGEDMAHSISDAKASNSTPMGQQANRLDNVIHGRVLMQQAFDPNTGEYSMNPAQTQELIMSVAKAISPTGVLSEQAQKDLSSPTMYGKAGAAWQYLSGSPAQGSTQDILKLYRDMLDRQGAVSNDLFNAHAARELAGFRGLQQRDSLLHGYIMAHSFGTNDYRTFVQNGPDAALSNVPPAQQMGGNGVMPNSGGQPNPMPVNSPPMQQPASKPIDTTGRVMMIKPGGAVVAVAAKDVIRARAKGYQVK